MAGKKKGCVSDSGRFVSLKRPSRSDAGDAGQRATASHAPLCLSPPHSSWHVDGHDSRRRLRTYCTDCIRIITASREQGTPPCCARRPSCTSNAASATGVLCPVHSRAQRDHRRTNITLVSHQHLLSVPLSSASTQSSTFEPSPLARTMADQAIGECCAACCAVCGAPTAPALCRVTHSSRAYSRPVRDVLPVLVQHA
jgi:hypothetical protein